MRCIIKKGIIEETDICYSNMYKLGKSINLLKEKINYQYRANRHFKKQLILSINKPSAPIFFDIYSFGWIFKDYSFFKILNKKKEKHFKSYLFKYRLYIDSLEKYIEKRILLGNISYSLLLDLEVIVEYKMRYGYSLSSYSKLITMFKELNYSLTDY